MKRILITLLSLSSILCIAENRLSDLEAVKTATIDFLELKKNAKNEWLDLIKAEKINKADLIQKHINEWIDLMLKNVKKMPNSFDTAEVTHLKREHLLEAVDLYEQQGKEWKAVCTEHVQKAKNLAAKSKDELNIFKQKYGLQPTPNENEEIVFEIDEEETTE